MASRGVQGHNKVGDMLAAMGVMAPLALSAAEVPDATLIGTRNIRQSESSRIGQTFSRWFWSQCVSMRTIGFR